MSGFAGIIGPVEVAPPGAGPNEAAFIRALSAPPINQLFVLTLPKSDITAASCIAVLNIQYILCPCSPSNSGKMRWRMAEVCHEIKWCRWRSRLAAAVVAATAAEKNGERVVRDHRGSVTKFKLEPCYNEI